MNNTETITSTQLREALALREQIDALEIELRACLSAGITKPQPQMTLRTYPPRDGDQGGIVHKRQMSAAARRKISRMMKARWAEYRRKRENSVAA